MSARMALLGHHPAEAALVLTAVQGELPRLDRQKAQRQTGRVAEGELEVAKDGRLTQAVHQTVAVVHIVDVTTLAKAGAK